MEEHGRAENDGAMSYTTAKSLYNSLKAARLAATKPIPKAPKAADIRLSSFSGRYTEWAGWRSEFQAKVLDTALAAPEKIGLLLGALTKEAQHCAGRAERLDDIELNRIWDKLVKTYDNKYQQVCYQIYYQWVQ